MRPGPTPWARRLQTHLWWRGTKGLQILPTTPSGPGIWIGAWGGKVGLSVEEEVVWWWCWWELLQGELGDPLCPEAVWKGHCPWGVPTGPCCRVSAGRVVFVQTGSGRLRGACPSKACLLFARTEVGAFVFGVCPTAPWNYSVPLIHDPKPPLFKVLLIISLQSGKLSSQEIKREHKIVKSHSSLSGHWMPVWKWLISHLAPFWNI